MLRSGGREKDYSCADSLGMVRGDLQLTWPDIRRPAGRFSGKRSVGNAEIFAAGCMTLPFDDFCLTPSRATLGEMIYAIGSAKRASLSIRLSCQAGVKRAAAGSLCFALSTKHCFSSIQVIVNQIEGDLEWKCVRAIVEDDGRAK